MTTPECPVNSVYGRRHQHKSPVCQASLERQESATLEALTATTARGLIKHAAFLLIPLCIFLCAPHTAHAGILSRPANNLGLVGYWPLDENAGTTLRDLSGTGNTGALVNSPTWVPGEIGSALQLDGSTQYFTVHAGANLKTSVFTYAMWVKYTGTDGTLFTTNPGGSARVLFSIGSNKLSIARFGQFPPATSIGNVPTGQWVHVAITYDASDNYVFYINGVASGSGNYHGVGFDFAGTVNNFQIGTNNPSGGYMAGSIDDFRIYNRALSAQDIANIYNANRTTRDASPTTLLTNGLVGYWTFDGHTINWASNTVADASGQGNTGSLVNMSTTSSPTVGTIGQALKFNGTSQSVQVPSSSLFDSIPGTWSVWIKTTKTGTGNPYAFMARTDALNSRNGVVMNITPSTGVAGVQIASCCANNIGSVNFGSNSIADGKWHNLVAVFNPIGGNLLTYLDGASVGSGAISGGSGPWSFNGQPVYIGQSPDGFFQKFTGSIDEARIYNRALSATEIQELYKAGGGVTQDASNPQVLTNGGLVGHWSFDGKYLNWATNQALDSSGQGNNGTLVNMVQATSPSSGKIGQALKFNGSLQQDITTGKSVSTLCSATTCTLSIWVYPTGSSPIVANAEIGQAAIGDAGGNMGIYRAAIGGADRIWVYNWDGSEEHIGIPYTPNTWTHIVWVHTGGVLYAYINGAFVGSIASGAELGPSNITIGRGYTVPAGGTYWVGSLDDVRIYNRALTAAEVKQLYAAGK